MPYDIEKEKWEAIEAGQRALQSLRCAQNNLNNARGWGVLDMLGGGLLSDMVKYSKMNDAKQYMEQARYDLQNFGRELSDVTAVCDLHIETSDFLAFADIFFDGLLADCLMQSRINDARRQVNEAIQRTEQILSQLQRM